mmetsp:Transcript_12516/g.27092  ORF Transcript_12516/g.27092 Transcript_12516/m.27092 type:complete len:226 (-) Transcript_12516:526-1203(-)
MRKHSTVPEPSSTIVAASASLPMAAMDLESSLTDVSSVCATLPLGMAEKSTLTGHDSKLERNAGVSAPSSTLLTFVHVGLPEEVTCAMPLFMPERRSSAEAPLPTQTKISASLATMKTSSLESISLCSGPPLDTSLSVIEPDASLTLMSLMVPLAEVLLASLSSSGTTLATSPFPPSAVQKASVSSPCSMTSMRALPLRSTSRMAHVTSRAFVFSFRLHLAPFHW